MPSSQSALALRAFAGLLLEAKTRARSDSLSRPVSQVAGLLDLLAHVSLDATQQADASPDTATQPVQADLPSSTLERLKELIKELEGKQLLLILDYEGCAEAVARPSPAMARLLKLYPVAVVQRTPVEAPREDPFDLSRETSADALRSSGIMSSKDLFEIAERAERATTVSRSDLFSSNHSAAAAALEALGSISGVRIVSFGWLPTVPPNGGRGSRNSEEGEG